jgi:uncharacterized protein DUF4893
VTAWLNKRVKLSLPALTAFALAACAPDRVGPETAVPAAQNWRSVATANDRERLRGWRAAWVRGLAGAQAGGHAAEVAAEGVLLEPDAALAAAAPPPGDYRCRTIKVGAKSQGLLDYVAYPHFACRLGPAAADGTLAFVKSTGSQRPAGRLFRESDRRMIFLGTLQLGDEQGILRYGHDEERDLIAVLERIGERRWRLVFPYPHFESIVDVIELIPAS